MTADFEVKTGWIVETIEDFCIRVADGTHDSPQRADIGKPLVTSKNIIGGRLDLSNTYNISVNDFIAINKRSAVHKNDVLLSMIGTVGEACLIEEEPNFAIKNVGLLKNDDEYKAKWLYFYLRSPKAQQLIKERLRGTTQQYLPLGEIRKFPVLYPQARHELELIVDNLWTLHSKIELNRQINQTLESMAQIIFKSWFVDFEPVKAKIVAIEAGEDAEGVNRATMRAISGKTDDELDQMQVEQPENYAQLKTTAELFPAAMQDSELGEVPEGWEISTIGEEVGVVGGGTPSTKIPEFWDGGEIHWTTPKDLSNLSDKVLLTTDRKITDAGLKKISSGLLPINTVLMSSRAPVGYLALAKVPVAVNQGYIAMLCDKRLSPEFVIQWCNSVMDEIKQRSSGTTFAEISKKNFKVILVVVSSGDIQQSYSEMVSCFYDKITEKAIECKTLADIRDSLLPKLLSGEVIP